MEFGGGRESGKMGLVGTVGCPFSSFSPFFSLGEE